MIDWGLTTAGSKLQNGVSSHATNLSHMQGCSPRGSCLGSMRPRGSF